MSTTYIKKATVKKIVKGSKKTLSNYQKQRTKLEKEYEREFKKLERYAIKYGFVVSHRRQKATEKRISDLKKQYEMLKTRVFIDKIKKQYDKKVKQGKYKIPWDVVHGGNDNIDIALNLGGDLKMTAEAHVNYWGRALLGNKKSSFSELMYNTFSEIASLLNSYKDDELTALCKKYVDGVLVYTRIRDLFDILESYASGQDDEIEAVYDKIHLILVTAENDPDKKKVIKKAAKKVEQVSTGKRPISEVPENFGDITIPDFDISDFT